MVSEAINKFANVLSEEKGPKVLIIKTLIFLAILFPIVFIGLLRYLSAEVQLTQQALEQRKEVAVLGARSVESDLDRLTSIGISFSTRVRFRELIQEGKWGEAIVILEEGVHSFPEIERVFLSDLEGNEMADYPVLPGGVGKNYSHRDWYKEVSKDWEPYISEVYLRNAEPQINLVAVAIPIKDSQNTPIGILVMQLHLDKMLEWSRDVEIGEKGIVYVVDQNGVLVAHPSYDTHQSIIDYSELLPVKNVLNGESGVVEHSNSIEKEQRVAGYAPVNGSKWGVVVAEPVESAFASRDRQLSIIAGFYSIMAALSGFLAYLLLMVISELINDRRKEALLLRSIGDGVFAVDHDFNITLWNKKAEEITGWKEKEVLGKPFRDIIKLSREHDRSDNAYLIEQTVLYGEARTLENSTVLTRKDGTDIYIGDSSSPIIGSSGKVKGAIVVFRDTSKEHEVESMRSDYTYASYQMKSPVEKAMSSIESALNAEKPDEKKKLLNSAYLSMRNAHKLIGQLIKASELEQGRVIARDDKFDLLKVIHSVIESTQIVAESKRISVKLETDKKKYPIVSDAEILSRVLSQIVENAISYNKEGGRVEIVVDKTDQGILIEVKDTGVGIPEAQQPFIFTKFFRGGNIDTNSTTGTGLGMYMASEYLKLVGGKIWFESSEGIGTTIFILLPVGR